MILPKQHASAHVGSNHLPCGRFSLLLKQEAKCNGAAGAMTFCQAQLSNRRFRHGSQPLTSRVCPCPSNSNSQLLPELRRCCLFGRLRYELLEEEARLLEIMMISAHALLAYTISSPCEGTTDDKTDCCACMCLRGLEPSSKGSGLGAEVLDAAFAARANALAFRLQDAH